MAMESIKFDGLLPKSLIGQRPNIMVVKILENA